MVSERAQSWSYRGQYIEVVQSFTYAGATHFCVVTEYHGEWTSYKCKLCIGGYTKIYVLIWSLKLYVLVWSLLYNIYFKIVDTKILPILMIGAELRGSRTRNHRAQVLAYGCKIYLIIYVPVVKLQTLQCWVTVLVTHCE